MTPEQLVFLKPHIADQNTLLEEFTENDFNDGTLMGLVEVKLRSSSSLAMYDCHDMILEKDDVVIVETGRGLALGRVVAPTSRRKVKQDKLSRVIRKATSNDMRQRDRNLVKEEAAYDLCKESIQRFGLAMKLVRVNYLHGGNKAVFYFSADGRVDFRDLVRELAKRLHIRVEMRQIGVRDASRLLGGLGACGLRLCCNRHIREFATVSIRMAKDQDLVLNPEKVSGLCSRLMCCLAYEDGVYREEAKTMPRVGRRVITPKGEGRIRDRDVLKRVVRVQIATEPGLMEFPVSEVKPVGITEKKDPGEHDDAGKS
jgi:cell fate regulator YaaT (PSP1 superfamily)